jgi:hypothetical protein
MRLLAMVTCRVRVGSDGRKTAFDTALVDP